MAKNDGDDLTQVCELCPFPHVHHHRIIFGQWGGQYDPDNVALLCPNHHFAIHYVADWFMRGPRGKPVAHDPLMLDTFMADAPLRSFWLRVQKPAAIERLVAEGRWHPYVRDPNLYLPRNRRK